jgi:hypothetical protein
MKCTLSAFAPTIQTQPEMMPTLAVTLKSYLLVKQGVNSVMNLKACL